MAELTHDASGLASSEPAGIAAQQANGPTSSDEGKLRVFISYSRDDLDFADQLDAALNAYGFECLIDRHGISGGEHWKQRLGNMTSEADTVVFVLSPNSVCSEICNWEVEEATRLNKRILPIVFRPLEGASPPSRLQDRNYIFFYKEPKLPGSGFGTGLAKLVTALNTDFDWLREHTRYLQRATEWDARGRPANRLLSGDDIDEAKAWATRRPKSAPEPTALHLDFIRASEEEAGTRLATERKHLEAVAAAQAEREKALHEAEEALNQAADAQRKRARVATVRNIALVAVSILALLAGLLGWRAQQNLILAEQEKEQADDVLDRAVAIIVNLQDRLDVKTQQQVFALFTAGAKHGDARAMRSVGYAYDRGLGVPQDRAKSRELYEKAAAKGDWGAMYNLGLIYNNGEGVAQDYAKAREWYEKAGDRAIAMTSLGVLYENGRGVAQDYVTAREWYEKAAAKDYAIAMTSLGLLYENGRGVAQDYVTAREWYEKAAAKDYAIAMNNLGLLYENGRGVAQDYVTAREWYENAAAKDYAIAMNNLGLLYANGRGVAKDYAKAHEWYEKAVANGDENAQVRLDELQIREAAETGRYAEALQLQEASEVKVEAAETKREGKPGDRTGWALHSVAWRALFAGEFPKALAASDRSHTLLPRHLAIETNRAHALLFIGHFEEAKALYLAHKGEVFESSSRVWEQVIAEDFADLGKAGLTHPMMADIEKELGISPNGESDLGKR